MSSLNNPIFPLLETTFSEIDNYKKGRLNLFKTELDPDGYLKFRNSKILVHRFIARIEIYEPNINDYSLLFNHYQVHHIDENRLNNQPNNLQILTQEEHEKLHGFKFQ